MTVQEPIKAGERKVPDPRREPLATPPIYPANRCSRSLGRVRSVREPITQEMT
jgi:hypothetical protein